MLHVDKQCSKALAKTAKVYTLHITKTSNYWFPAWIIADSLGRICWGLLPLLEIHCPSSQSLSMAFQSTGSRVSILSREDNSLAFCHMEASRTVCAGSKLQHDKVKLAIETKCSLDNILLKSCYPADNNSPALPSIQICGTKSRVSILALVDSGLYAYSTVFDLSLQEKHRLICRRHWALVQKAKVIAISLYK